jgi:diacylglycerol kinase
MDKIKDKKLNEKKGQFDRYPLHISFGFAFKGIIEAVKRERNVKIHLTAMTAATVLGLLLSLSRLEWIVLISLFGTVIGGEIINSSVEETCNVMKEELGLPYPATYWPRNFAAGGVMVFAIASAVVGLLIFAPKLINLFG